ncbi:hypothetical protein ACWDR0_26840 [Streptomyces sp. NPDC003691]
MRHPALLRGLRAGVLVRGLLGVPALRVRLLGVRLLMRVVPLVLGLVLVRVVRLVLLGVRGLLRVLGRVPLAVAALHRPVAVAGLPGAVLLLLPGVVRPAGVLLVLLVLLLRGLVLPGVVRLLGLLVRVLDPVALTARSLLVVLLLAAVPVLTRNGLRSVPLIAVERVVRMPRFGAGAPAIISHRSPRAASRAGLCVPLYGSVRQLFE